VDDVVSVEPETRRRSTLVPLCVGIVVALAGFVALARTGTWYVLDVSSAAQLHDPSAAYLAIAVAAVVLVGGISLVLLRSRLTGAMRTGLVVGTGAVSLAGAWLAVDAFPSVQKAFVAAVDPGTGFVEWRTEVPLVRVHDVLEATTDEITVEGSWTDHGCGSDHRSVTLDRQTGEILETEDLPTSYPSIDDVPPTEPLSAYDLLAEDGSLPFLCLN
jgi:uncharacterized protein YhhL (DUF1145 family)